MAYFHGMAIMHDPQLAPDLTGTERWVATWLFAEMYADAHGPKPVQRSLTTIATGTGLSEPTIHRAVRRLVALGYLAQEVTRLDGKLAQPSWWTPGRLTAEVEGWYHHDTGVVSPVPRGGIRVTPNELREKQGPVNRSLSLTTKGERRRSAARPTGARAPRGGDPKPVGEIVGMLPWLLDRPRREEP